MYTGCGENRDTGRMILFAKVVSRSCGINEFSCRPLITREIISKLIEGNRFMCVGHVRVRGGGASGQKVFSEWKVKI